LEPEADRQNQAKRFDHLSDPRVIGVLGVCVSLWMFSFFLAFVSPSLVLLWMKNVSVLARVQIAQPRSAEARGEPQAPNNAGASTVTPNGMPTVPGSRIPGCMHRYGNQGEATTY
jgi:hypothetical protein